MTATATATGAESARDSLPEKGKLYKAIPTLTWQLAGSKINAIMPPHLYLATHSSCARASCKEGDAGTGCPSGSMRLSTLHEKFFAF